MKYTITWEKYMDRPWQVHRDDELLDSFKEKEEAQQFLMKRGTDMLAEVKLSLMEQKMIHEAVKASI